MSIALDHALLDPYDSMLAEAELYLEHCIRNHNTAAYQLLRTIFPPIPAQGVRKERAKSR